MKGFRKLLMLTALLTFGLQFTQAQEGEDEEEALSFEKGDINSQFEFIYKKSGNYRSEGKRYEVVRTISFDQLRKNVMDTLSGFNTRAAELKATISGHESTIGSLEKKLEDTTNSLASVTEEKDNMSFLGIAVSKGTYNALLWTVIAGLLILLLFFIYRFRNSNILTQEAKTNLSDLETEYEEHRRRALEREQKISRQLQDEINKYKKQK